MATTVIRYVDPNSSGGDGTTNALSGATAAYASLSAWEAARQRNLVTADEIERVICSSDDAGSTHAADTTAVTLDGWTTDATRYIQIEAASSHGGKWNTAKYRLQISNAIAVNIYEDYIRINGVQIETITPSVDNRHGIYIEAGLTTYIRISNTIIKGHNHATYIQDGISISTACGAVDIWNTVIWNLYGLASSRCINSGTPGNCTIYNSTTSGGGVGVRKAASSIVVCKNVLAVGASAGCFVRYDVSGLTNYNCASSDATADDFGGSGNIVNQTYTFVNAANGDFHLISTDPMNNGLSDPGSGLFSDDIDGVTRTGTWDIGADEYVAAGGSILRQMMAHHGG